MADKEGGQLAFGLSTGAGIAIAGMWIAGAALTAVLFLITFVWGDGWGFDGPELKGWKAGTFLLVFFLWHAWPLLLAYVGTKRVLGQHLED